MQIKKRYFGTDGIRGKVGKAHISADWFLKLGWAIGAVLSKNKQATVIIGKDTRISGYMFESALEAGLVAAGVNVKLLGPMPTPSIAYSTKTLQADAGIVISASHNSYLDNGVKFFTPKGVKFSDELELEIESYIDKPMSTVVPQKLGKAERVNDAAGRYIEFCKSTFPSRLNLKNLKIVLDCANGATYYVAPNVFKELGAEVINIASTPDGLNINKDCGATDLELIIAKVGEFKADIGIALDGDGDRVMMVDHAGNVLDGDDLLLIIVRAYLQLGYDVGGVVGTLMSNLALEEAVKDLGLPFARTSVGDRHIQAALFNRQWLLGGEPSGHIICANNHSTGDGIIAALKVLAAIQLFGQTLFELREFFKKTPQVLINIPISNDFDLNFAPVQNVIEAMRQQLGTTGRIFVRNSGTEPLVRIMVEGQDLAQLQQVADEISGVIKNEFQAI
jgi:phosphoglucosamine mutase